MKKFKDRIELYKGFIRDKKVDPGYYTKLIKEAQKIINLVEKAQLTPEIFEKLKSQDKWDLYYLYLKKRCKWYCKCGNKTKPKNCLMDDYVYYCTNCEAILTYRTGGGQNNPFNWTFKWKKKELRRQKLIRINELK